MHAPLLLIWQTPSKSGDEHRLSILRNLTMDDLEDRLGKGRVVIGGHPNSGRIWRTKAFDIGADGFDRDQKGSLLTDGFAITKWKGNAANLYPFTLLPGLKQGGVIALNNSPNHLEQMLLPVWKCEVVSKNVNSSRQSVRFTYQTKPLELTLTGNYVDSHLVELILWIGR